MIIIPCTHNQNANGLFLDQSSTRIGFSILRMNDLIVGSVKPKGSDTFFRMDNFIDLVEELLSWDIEYCYYEGGTTMGPMNSSWQKRLANVMEYEIEKLCSRMGIPVDTIHNQTLKANIIHLSGLDIKNTKDKQVVLTALTEVIGDIAHELNEDSRDAAAMGLLKANGLEKPLSPKKKKTRAKGKRNEQKSTQK